MSQGLAERIGELADAPLLLEPRDHRTELLANRTRLGPETLDDPAAGDLPSLLDRLSADLRERLAAAGRDEAAFFCAWLPAEDRGLSCATTSRSRAQILEGPVPFLTVESAVELVAHWRARVAADRNDDAPGTPVPIWLVELR